MHISNLIFRLFPSILVCFHMLAYPDSVFDLSFFKPGSVSTKKDTETETREGFSCLFLFIFILFLDRFSNLFPALEWVVTLGAVIQNPQRSEPKQHAVATGGSRKVRADFTVCTPQGHVFHSFLE